MLFNALNLIFLNVTMLNCTKKIFTQISLAGLYYYAFCDFACASCFILLLSDFLLCDYLHGDGDYVGPTLLA